MATPTRPRISPSGIAKHTVLLTYTVIALFLRAGRVAR